MGQLQHHSPPLVVALDLTGSENTTTSTYSTQWQVLNETNQDGTASNYVWSQLYVDGMAARDTLSSTGSLTARAYPRQDELPAGPGGCSNWNVTSLITYSGGTWTTAERFESTPYGVVTVLNSNFTTKTGGSGLDWDQFHQGLFYDPATGLYYNRARFYDPAQGRFISADPLGYPDGGSRYQALTSRPLSLQDPMGLQGGNRQTPPPTQREQLASKLKGALSAEQAACPDCLAQADELAKAIADAVASQPWQLGGNPGNAVSGVTGLIGGVLWDGLVLSSWLSGELDPSLVNPLESAQTGGWGNQCGDWQRLLQDAIAQIMGKHGKNACFAAKTVDGFKKGDRQSKTHNWVEIIGGNGKVTVDPWPSGGGKLVDDSASGKYYQDPGLDQSPNLIPGSPNKPNPNPCKPCGSQPNIPTTKPSNQ